MEQLFAGWRGELLTSVRRTPKPTLVVWGEHDVTADSRPLVAQLTAGHPQREGAVIDGAGHWVQYERAAQVNALLSRFFSWHPRA